MDDLFRRSIVLFATTALCGFAFVGSTSAQVPGGAALDDRAPANSVPAEPGGTAQAQPTPEIIRGPTRSQLVGVRQVPSYSSPLSEFLGQSPRASTDAELNRYFRSTTRRRLVKVPEMFGDFRRLNSFATIDEGTFATTGTLTHAAGVSGLKIAENNQAITADRVWFGFSHMHDALESTNGLTGVGIDQSLNRFTIGFEKTLLDGLWSIEVRSVMAGSVNEDVFDLGTFGDAQFIFKRLLYADGCRASSMGLGLELPTGAQGRLFGDGIFATLDSDSVHLIPFYASTRRFGTRAFGHLFAQLDIPLGTDETSVVIQGGPTFDRTLRAPVTASIDAGLGYWLLAPMNANDSGLAVVAEAHYTSRLDSADQVTFTTGFPNTINRGEVIEDVLNVTTGLHAELLSNWAVRGAFSIPVTNDKLFDSELMLQINRTF